MTQSYDKDCIFCPEKIRMSDESGKWLPYNKDGSVHDCKTNGKTNGKQKAEDKKRVTLEMVQRKLESIGITLDLDKLMGQAQ